jgi:hypothetical protein
VRWLLAAVLWLSGCGSGLQFNVQNLTADQLLDRATLVFTGTIERQTLVNWPFLRVPGQDAAEWRVLDRRVRIEVVARGQENRKLIDTYEITSGAGRNLTENQHRYLFFVRPEGNRYHVVLDWKRCIFPIESGKHDRLPLDDSRSLWERIALLQYWVQPGWSPAFLRDNSAMDPGRTLGQWRRAKLLRGLLHHPDSRVRVAACDSLIRWGQAQDECRTPPSAYYNGLEPSEEWRWNRRWENTFSRNEWKPSLSRKNDPGAMDYLKLFTTINNRQLREEYCRLFLREFPNDHDNGCPADQPPPATIVTINGDVPLLGDWPANY